MPSSRPNTIPSVIHLIQQLKPESILDVGVGFGKWGHLFREYTDIVEAENEPSRYQKENWRVRIDGIEGFPAYVTEMHRFLYNTIHLGEASQVLPGLPSYDVVFLGDVLEHFTKEAGFQVLRAALEKANKAVIVSTPRYETGQDSLCGNTLERHQSLWHPRDFRKFCGASVRVVDGATLVIVLPKSGQPELDLRPPRQARGRAARLMVQARAELQDRVALDFAFILVDEQQLSGTLPHTAAMPFLEKNGQYWGPPADDQTAIRELERMRQEGARFLAFIWSTFWWLDHYQVFRDHLEANYPRVHSSPALLIYQLHQ